MRIILFFLMFTFAHQAHSQSGENLRISTTAATAARDSFAVYRNQVSQTLMENQDSARALMLPRYFEVSEELVTALSTQLANQGENDNVFARLGIMFDANNKPFVTLIFETRNTNTQTSTFFDFTRPCPPACPD